MKRRKLTPIAEFRLGDLYLFHPSNPRCPASSSLWGFYDKRINGVIYLEHSSHNLSNFRLWHPSQNTIATIVYQQEANLEIICIILGYSRVKNKDLSNFFDC